ncbi:uncharacterized protein [Miscanthus floridulus]|uniref:uncharacterized protein n=1 Tax=Miscanthus floridulus TaxID=154761 RepID=UPI00345796DF
MDDNPLFYLGSSDSDDTSEVSFTSSIGDDAPATTPPTAILQTVNIKSHIPIVLELATTNYDEWRCFFDAFLGKFGLTSHVSSPPIAEQRHDPDWRVVDQCILSWLYNSIAKDMRDIGDMDITQYTGRLKQLADALRDVGQPVRETSQVLNMLRGLSSKYHHAIPAITAKQPPHTFLSRALIPSFGRVL